MKILIVEDEMKTLNGIQHLIEEIGGDFQVVGRAKSGEEGIQQALVLRPDVVISDIRMNGMTGLEMMRCLSEQQFSGKYIILSGHAEFQYAREAMLLGSVDYLLKPVTREQLEQALRKTEAIIREESSKIHTKSFTTGQLFERVLYMPEFQHSKFFVELEKRMEESKRSYLLLIRGENRFVQADYQAIIEELELCLLGIPFYPCWDDGHKEIFVLIQASQEEVLQPLDDLVAKCRGKINPFVVFAGDQMEELQELHTMRDRLKDNTEWNLTLRTPAVINEERIQGIAVHKFTYPSELERQILRYISDGEIEGVEGELEKFIEYLNSKTYAYLDIREALICMTAAVLYAIRRENYGLYENISNLNILEWVRDSLFTDHYCQIIMNILRQYERYTKNIRSGNHPIVNKVLKIIEQEYKEELSLDEIAQRMNVTPEYLSSLFMKEIGIKFTTYRTQKRIETAKQLLKEGKKKIYEIAEESGYTDVRYFTKVFKKFTGMSPGEYIRSQQEK